MKLELMATSYFILLGTLVIGAVLFTNSTVFDQIWFALNWSTLLIGGLYFATNTKNRYVMIGTSILLGQVFSMLCFEIIGVFDPIALQGIEKPSTTFVWWVIALMSTLTIITLTNERKNSSRDSENN